MEITYQLIKPIIVKEEFVENRYKLEFQASGQKSPVFAVARIKEEDIKFEKPGLFDKILISLGLKKENKEPVIDERVKQAAIVKSFKDIEYLYEYNEQEGKWTFNPEKA